MGTHYVERHLHGIEAEIVLGGDLQHVKMDLRIFMAGEPDKPYFARFFGFQQCFLGSALSKDPRTKQEAARQLDESLVRLQTDHVDLIQHHKIIRFEDPDLELVGYFRDRDPGVALERELIKRVASYGLTLDCDFYNLR